MFGEDYFIYFFHLLTNRFITSFFHWFQEELVKRTLFWKDGELRDFITNVDAFSLKVAAIIASSSEDIAAQFCSLITEKVNLTVDQFPMPDAYFWLMEALSDCLSLQSLKECFEQAVKMLHRLLIKYGYTSSRKAPAKRYF